jgi:hypothetical protein
MEAKILFLAIPDKEFSKIITEEANAYILYLVDRYNWNHRIGFKFITPISQPVELIKHLTQANIRHVYIEFPINL